MSRSLRASQSSISGFGKTIAESEAIEPPKRFLHDAVPHHRLFYPVKCEADVASGALALSSLRDQRAQQSRIMSDWKFADVLSNCLENQRHLIEPNRRDEAAIESAAELSNLHIKPGLSHHMMFQYRFGRHYPCQRLWLGPYHSSQILAALML